jgi:DNA-binding XRE family transcriptional regulator
VLLGSPPIRSTVELAYIHALFCVSLSGYLVPVSKPAIGRAIRFARNRAQISAASLAEHSGVSEQTILRIERGENLPSLPTICRIAEALKVEVSFLISEPSRKNTE